MAALASLFEQTPSKTLQREGEIGASAEPITEALRVEHRGNDFLFRSTRKEYVRVSGFEGAESNHCKLWDEQTELSSCPLTAFPWSQQWLTGINELT